ncbi:hypothetical protein N7492_004974 [Penicillium capsulatum]|uniref:Uncharacterized protein n=1 Tax=Penicillium capsulatum TaxID=69766 RepID=A0A9W9IBH2_9EURO|nr:hypothetical protein N7492_004974 [Penicillium capsulatum]KAJ6135918.1 hypothetical protein N7512_001078 [Penicillium capsulatum]
MGSSPSREAQRAAARERARATRKKQEDALANLTPNTLQIALYLRSDPPLQNDFHWALYFHRQASGGTKYQVENPYKVYMPNHGHTGGIFKENFLCALIKIASIPEDLHATFDQIVRSRDGDLGSIPGVTCRVWLLEILRQLSLRGIVHCDDVGILERECFDIGNRFSAAAAQNEQPRPVVDANLCIWDRHATGGL